MGFSLMHAGLAAGAALAVLPVILHLFMRQKPKHVVFPALRLIRERQKRSTKKLRVKNWLLLLARMALLALMALALARPVLHSATAVGNDDVPSATALVFDTSLSMDYKPQDRTRLDEAREKAYEILKKRVNTSLIFVIDASSPVEPKGVSPALARKQVESLAISNAARPLNLAVAQAYKALLGADRPRREVFVFTDLARSAWELGRSIEGLDKAKAAKKDIKTVILQFRPDSMNDVAVTDVRPATDVVTEGEPVEITATIRSLGPQTNRVAELWVDGVNYPRDKKTVEIPANGEATVTFTIPKVDASNATQQGRVRLTGGSDPLKFDDERFFTFSVKPAIHVLIVSDRAIDAKFITDAIDPDPTPGLPRPFRAERVSTTRFSESTDNLGKRYRCIFVNNVEKLIEADWARLSGYVQEGGGLVIGLGPAASPDNYLGSTPASILPAELDKPVHLTEPTSFGQVADYTHPLFSRFTRELDAAISQVPIQGYWSVKPRDGSRVLLSYADKSPALVERMFKGSRTGRVLLWTTPLSREPDARGSGSWNEFPIVGWSYWFLMNQTVGYLADLGDENRTFESGNDVFLPLDPTRRFRNYSVQPPGKRPPETLVPPADSPALPIVAPQQLGNWIVKSADSESHELLTGFSLNAPASETNFAPVVENDLDRVFDGKDGEAYVLVKDPREAIKTIQILTVGRELFPWLMMLIMILVTLESILANRFYRESSPRGNLAAAA